MLHPSYNELIDIANKDVAEGEEPIVESRYSIVTAAAKRARQLIGGQVATVPENGRKPLSVAVDELNAATVQIIRDDQEA